jgi:hypothetical protein
MQKRLVPFFIAASLLIAVSGCQKQSAQPVVVPTAAVITGGAPASPVAPANPVASVAAPELVVPPEDKMEPMSLDKARLPGGAELPAEPVSAAKKKTP